MRTSVLFLHQAQQAVKEFFAQKDIEWNNERFLGDYYIEESSATCSCFPCPHELDNWGGEVEAIYVYDNSNNEEVFAVAYMLTNDFYLVQNHNGDHIESASSYEEALSIIDRYEREDKQDDTYEAGFYEVARWSYDENRFVPFDSLIYNLREDYYSEKATDLKSFLQSHNIIDAAIENELIRIIR